MLNRSAILTLINMRDPLEDPILFVNDVFADLRFPHLDKRASIPLIKPTREVPRISVEDALNSFALFLRPISRPRDIGATCKTGAIGVGSVLMAMANFLVSSDEWRKSPDTFVNEPHVQPHRLRAIVELTI